ncbi:Peptidoglycan-binding domain 1 protein [Gloeomargarita lithophora Alchichica-D10]|uniref:Peptidoglycan-binding domain 1 protein n=1 Tax=Gloeomargarita lithophora Alchichica-D10 TaxID=1188229 RepID=A0A1J0A9B6_9CYAN|nr:transporter substrate-binding domain-containing protein [Gloeomargarita lithophora]APB32536.1 Peptidoglycan-binding domain 1 protein [Gloeomargarita lithophora Alchichica-D10]
MLKRFCWLLVVALGWLILGVAPALALAPDIQAIQQRGVLRVAMLGQDNPPFFAENAQGQLTGVDVDLARNLATTLGVKADFIRTAQTFDQVTQLVYSNQADVAISKLTVTLPRATEGLFSQPYLVMRDALILNRLQLAQKGLQNQDALVSYIRQFSGRLGVITQTAHTRIARRRFPKAEIIEYPRWSEVVTAVEQGQVLAAFRDELEVRQLVLSQPELALYLKTAVLSDSLNLRAVLLPWNSYNLRDLVNQYLTLEPGVLTIEKLLQAPIAI